MWGQPKRTAVSGPAPTGELLYQSFFAPPSGVFAFTRAGNAWGFDSTGTLIQAASGISRQVYDPATLAPLGTLLEPASTNQVRNPRCEGAVPGTPGTPPTYMSVFATAGLSASIVAVGTESGIPYVDVRWFGTTTGTATAQMRFDSSTAIAALTGQTWTASAFVRLIAGSVANANPAYPQLQIIEGTSTGTFVAGGGQTIAPTGAALATQRAVYTRTLSGGATVAVVQENFTAIFPTATVVDFTIRIGLPQIEQQSYVSSPIMPPAGSPAASTRAVDTLTLALPYAGFPGPIGWTAALEFVPQALIFSGILGLYSNSTGFNDSSYVTISISGILAVNKRVGGSGVTSPASAASAAVGVLAKIALACDTAASAISFNGNPVVSAVFAGYPTMDSLIVGGITNGASNRFPVIIRRLRFWSSKLSATELQAMTS